MGIIWLGMGIELYHQLDAKKLFYVVIVLRNINVSCKNDSQLSTGKEVIIVIGTIIEDYLE